MNNNKTIYFVIIIVAIVLSFTIPFNMEISPERQLKIVDSDRKPLPNAVVRQTWYQYSLEKRGEVDILTNEMGEIFFPKRVIRTRIFSLIFGAIKQVRDLGIHASVGSDESIGVFAKGYENKWFHGGSAPKKGQIILVKGKRG